jgi:hypothetical protein
VSAAKPTTLDLAQIVSELERMDREVAELLAALSPKQLNWQPDGGRSWSIGQCIDHLAKSNRIMVRAMSDALQSARAAGAPAAAGPLRLSWIERLFVGSLEPPVRRRMKAAARAMPGSTLIHDELRREYAGANQAVRELALASRTFDLHRIRLASPFLRIFKYSLAAALAIIAAHDRRHLWQAARVREAPGFPPT